MRDISTTSTSSRMERICLDLAGEGQGRQLSAPNHEREISAACAFLASANCQHIFRRDKPSVSGRSIAATDAAAGKPHEDKEKPAG
ncbi:hypothetical protein [Bradyrhizobium japonicum]